MEEEQEIKPAEQVQEQVKRQLPEILKSYQFQPGKSGNPSGRPKGVKSMKQWVKEKLEIMDEEERLEFMRGLNKLDIWKMAEGNPDNGEKKKDSEDPDGAALKLTGEAFFNEEGKLIKSEQTAEILKQNGNIEAKENAGKPEGVNEAV